MIVWNAAPGQCEDSSSASLEYMGRCLSLISSWFFVQYIPTNIPGEEQPRYVVAIGIGCCKILLQPLVLRRARLVRMLGAHEREVHLAKVNREPEHGVAAVGI